MRTVIFSVVLLALTGCNPLMDPTFMPSGYTYHNDVYKSPPGLEAAPIGSVDGKSDYDDKSAMDVEPMTIMQDGH